MATPADGLSRWLAGVLVVMLVGIGLAWLGSGPRSPGSSPPVATVATVADPATGSTASAPPTIPAPPSPAPSSATPSLPTVTVGPPPTIVTPPAPAALAPLALAERLSPDAERIEEATRLVRAGRLGEACRRLEEVTEAEGRRQLARCVARLGREAYEAGEPLRAADHYQRAIAADQGVPELWAALATAWLKAGERGRAQEVLVAGLRTFPDHPELLYALAAAQERQGRTREAVDTLRRLLAASPGHARGQSLLATLEREQRVEGQYWAQESAHFLVRYEGASGIDLGRSVVDALEEARESIGRELGVYPGDRLQVGIYATQIFGDVIGAPPHLIAGAYDGRKIRLNLAASVAYSRDLTRLVRHEYAHVAIDLASSGRAPVWLHEGLAQVLEPRAAPRLLEVSVPREHLTLAGIERLSRTGSSAALVAGYGLTHVAVAHLVDRGGMVAMRDFLRRLGRGEAVPEALRQAFGLGPDAIEARLLAAAGRS